MTVPNMITIARGSRDGVKVRLPVVAPEGLIGRVNTVDERTCQVLLITAPSLEIGAKVNKGEMKW